MDIRVLCPGDDGLVAAASHLFDGPVGFVSGVEVTHPDKGTEMFLYELAVDETFRRGESGAPWSSTSRRSPAATLPRCTATWAPQTSRFSPQKQAKGLSLYGGISTYPAAR